MSTFFALLSLLIVFGMLFTVVYHAVKNERYYAALFTEEFIGGAAKIPDDAVINITTGGINE